MSNPCVVIDILSLFPGYFSGPFDESIVARAIKNGLVDIRLIDIRDYAEGKHNRVDDRPYGGGPGMVMMAKPVVEAIRETKKAHPDRRAKVIYLSPQGKPLTAQKCRELAKEQHLILLCGHYEGIDERALESDVDEEISIGDFVLTNGCIAAITLVDATLRFVPGVLGHEEAASEDTFENGRFDCPHYTRPEMFEGREVPSVLLSGHHEKITSWRMKKAEEKMRQMRPDLINKKVNKD